MTASDAAGNTRAKSATIHYLDDDEMDPTINITPLTQWITDATSSLTFSVSAMDPSGIASINVIFDQYLVGITAGTYVLPSPRDPGPHLIQVEATDNDLDRGTIDQSSNFSVGAVYITDDDATPPDINITYVGSKTDGDSGTWQVTTGDPESGISTMQVFIDDILIGTENGSYSVPNSLGNHTIRVNATNADLDRGGINQESALTKQVIHIIDDDTQPPEVSSLNILTNL
ncbi:MAG: hypothetical protein EAX96_17170 [Candidatus Lokiarchaeota archaeon]|nr:hypothetical protein [Candidatus Lokiarchaeota archaeon]